MKTDNVLYWVIYFVVTVIVAWIVLSLILLWFRPALYNPDGSINWWVTLWVAVLIILFAWILMIIITLIISLFAGSSKGCDPCAAAASQAAYDPRMWTYAY